MSNKCCEDYQESLNELGKFSLDVIKRFNKKFKNESPEIRFHLGVDLLEGLVMSFFMDTCKMEENIEIFCTRLTSATKEYIDHQENKGN